jgi:hypothetical protein
LRVSTASRFRFSARDSIPYVSIHYITVGQLMLTIYALSGRYKYVHRPGLIQNGYIAAYAIIATFLTANNANSIFNFLLGLSFERMVPIHNLASLVAVVLSLFHGYVAYVYGGGDSGDSSGGGGSRDRRLSSDGESQFSLYGSSPQAWKFMWDGGINTSGSLIILCLVGLVALSFFRVFRKYCFELWLYSHIFLALGVIIFGFMHSVGILVVPLVWWGLDLVLRYAVMTSCRSPSTAATLTKLTEDLVEILSQACGLFLSSQPVCPVVGSRHWSLQFIHHDLGSYERTLPFVRALALVATSSGIGWPTE